MDVRCERCRAQYVFDDEQVTPQGLTVQCTNCGHVFKVKKKELVVTVPVRPEDVTEQPMLATAAAPRPPAEAAPPRWTIRQAGGTTLAFSELTTLQKWIVERKVTRADEVSQGAGAWVRLGDIGELLSFFDVVDEAERGRRPPAPRPGGTDFYPPPPFPPPAPVPPPPSLPPLPAEPFRAGRGPAAPGPSSLTGELGPEELASVRGSPARRPRVAVVALLLLTVVAVLYVVGPALVGHDRAPAPAAIPAAAPAPAEAPTQVPAARPAPEPAPEPAAPVALEPRPPPEALRPPEPKPEEKAVEPVQRPEPTAAASQPRSPAPAAAPAPAGAKALLAEARRLREKGEAARALELFGRVAALEPRNVEAQTGRGLCYFELGQYASAETSFQRALQLDLEHPDAIMGLAETYRQQGKKAEALGLFERYLAVSPDGEEAAVARYAITQLKE